MKKFVVFLIMINIWSYNCFVYYFCRLTNYGNLNSFNKTNLITDAVDDEFKITTTYAKALGGCNLYKSAEMIQGFDSVYFEVPETYFVMILEKISDSCYKVQYDRFVGYVDAVTIEIATFTPIVKTLTDITFDIKSSSGTQVWKYPTTQSEICTTISAGTKGLTYIASVQGAVPSGGENNVWYYVCYTPDTNSTNVYEGYIYSENTINLSEIISNTETNPVVISSEQEQEKLLFISSTLKTIVVSIVAIPVILFFSIILYKIINKFRKNTKLSKNIKKIDDDSIDENIKSQNIKSIEKYKNMKLLKSKNTSNNLNNFDDEDLL